MPEHVPNIFNAMKVDNISEDLTELRKIDLRLFSSLPMKYYGKAYKIEIVHKKAAQVNY